MSKFETVNTIKQNNTNEPDNFDKYEEIFSSTFMDIKEKIKYFDEKVSLNSENAIKYLGHLYELQKDYVNL